MNTERQPSSPAPPSDEALMEAVAARADRNAFAELFQRFAGRIKGFLIKGGLAPALAEEIAQDVMVSVWRKAASFDAGRASVATWIYAIARNRRTDHLRQVPRSEPDPNDPLFAPEPDAGAEHVLAGSERDARVRRAVGSLSADQHEAVRLAFFAGLSHAEIAARLDAPLGTVKSRLRLAFARLRGELGADFSGELTDD